MQKWKITQIFINLPPQKQVVAGLLFTVLVLGTVVSAVVIHYEVKLSEVRADAKANDTANRKIIKSKDSTNIVLTTRYLDFMEREINTRFDFKNQIDSLKTIKNNRK